MPELNESSGDRIVATYELHEAGAAAEAVAGAIALEQTVEVPRALVDAADLGPEFVGQVERVGTGSPGVPEAVLSYDAAVVRAGGVPALLNLVFGNVSMMPGVRLTDLAVPDDVLATLDGPRHGLDGVRALTGVYGRPLLASALKPRGLPLDRFEEMAGAFARGGGDIIKDDQNLIDDFETFKHRVRRCADAVDRANQSTGRRCLYLPHVTGPLPALTRRFEYVARLGLPGVLACPFIAGFGIARSLARDHDLVLMAHPTFGGGHFVSPREGIAPDVVFGTLLRIAGADIAIFANAGGRFRFSREDCTRIAARLRAPLGGLAPAWPCPAGGMQVEHLPGMCADYGPDAVLLIGGALIGLGADLEASTRTLMDVIRSASEERLETPQPLRGHPARAQGPRVLAHLPGFEWKDRPGSAYKDASGLPAEPAFRGVRRVELVGRFGERSRTDLRYFEIEPGGHSSLEKHVHAHIVIGARGRGVLVLEGARETLGEMDGRVHRTARGPPVRDRAGRALEPGEARARPHRDRRASLLHVADEAWAAARVNGKRPGLRFLRGGTVRLEGTPSRDERFGPPFPRNPFVADRHGPARSRAGECGRLYDSVIHRV